MEIAEFRKQPIKENAHGIDARDIFVNEHIMLVHLDLKPGQSLLPHLTPVDVIFYMLEGEAIVTIGDEKKTITKDQAVFSPKNIKHCWENPTGENARILVMKTPKPTKPAVFI